MSRVKAFFTTREPYYGLIRYALGLMMLPYGISKIFKAQFVLIPFSSWQSPLESVSGIGLAWAYLGYSSWFQVLLGFCELIPSLLLLFRKTSLLGACLLLPVSLNVLLTNYAMQLWPETKQISLVLFVLNLLIFFFEWEKIKSAFTIMFNSRLNLKRFRWELLANLLIVSLITYFLSIQILSYIREKNFLTGDWYNKHPNEWTLVSESLNDSIFPKRKVIDYYGVSGQMNEINDSGFNATEGFTYSLDEKNHTLVLKDYSNNKTRKCTYRLLSDTAIELTSNDSLRNGKLVQTFKKRVMNPRSN